MKKRQKVTVRIEQQPAKKMGKRISLPYTMDQALKPALVHHLKQLTNRETLISAGALATIVLSAAVFAFGQDSVKRVEADVNQQVAKVVDIAPQPIAALVEKPLFPKQTQLKVSKGDTLMELLTDTGVSADEAYEAVAAIRKIYDPRRINSGQELDLRLEASDHSPQVPSLSELKMPISGTATIELHKIEDGKFIVKKVEVPVTAHPTYNKVSIRGSFYVSARKAGLTPKMIMELMKAFSYDVDFQRDIQAGHTLEVVVDELRRDDGKLVSSDNLRFAKLTLGRKKIAVYRYTDSTGKTAYYNEQGKAMKKSFMRTPIDGARISSNFGMRKHPVLGYNKMHKGMDFAASTGTPIYAAGDGTVDFASRKGGYGNYVRIKHNSQYSTAYAHASRFAKGIRPGVRVRQGQVIAYVGSTGRSTGPHLHYEVLQYGKQINPKKIQQFDTGTKLAGKELKRFKSLLSEVQMVMNDTAKTNKMAGKQPDQKKGGV